MDAPGSAMVRGRHPRLRRDVRHGGRALGERRSALEVAILEGRPVPIAARRTWRRILADDLEITAWNDKTGRSVNFPIITCRSVCAYCYALRGRLAHPAAIARGCAMWHVATADPIRAAERVARETRAHRRRGPLRIFGTGDAHPRLYRFLDALGEVGVDWYGFTRRTAAARRYAPRLLLSRDRQTSPPATRDGLSLAYVRMPGDAAPPWADVIFPLHGGGADPSAVPPDRRDCPAIRGRVHGCADCGRCWPRGAR